MTRTIDRRKVVLGGAAAAAVVVVTGGLGASRLLHGTAQRSPADLAAAEYAKFLADVRQDYVNGRVVEHSGWILSQHEADTIAQRAGEHTVVKPSTVG